MEQIKIRLPLPKCLKENVTNVYLQQNQGVWGSVISPVLTTAVSLIHDKDVRGDYHRNIVFQSFVVSKQATLTVF